MAYRLVCFDLDGTLVNNEKRSSWQVFHDHFGIDKNRRETARLKYLNGDITYPEWAHHDIGLWRERKVTKEMFLKALDENSLISGASEVLNELKSRGLKLAVISGSLSIVLERFIPDYKKLFDDIYLSWIEFDDAGFISKAKPTEYDMEGKAEALRIIAGKEGIPLSECVFVGDYVNDMMVMQEAGLSIAFNCGHDEVKRIADVVVEKKDLREILRFII